MASIFKRFIDKILGRKEQRITHVDPESIKKHHIIKSQQNKIAELTAELNKVKLEEFKEKKRKEDVDQEEKIKIYLNEEDKRLEEQKYPTYFSLKKFFNKLRYDKKLKQKLGFYSFDRSKKLSKFEDFGISPNGDFILIGEGNEVLLNSPNLNDIFQSVPALVNDVPAGKIPLNVTTDGKYVENFMVWEPAEAIPLPDGKFKWSHASKKPFYEKLAEQNQRISELGEELEQRELTITGLQNEVDELRIANNVSSNSAESVRKEMKASEQKVSEIERSFRGLQNELAQVRDTNTVLDGNLEKLEEEFEKMRDEAQRQKVKLPDDRAMELIQQIRRELVRDEPSKEVKIIQESQKSPQNLLK